MPGAYVLADLGGPLWEPLYPTLLDDAGLVTVVPPGHAATALLPGTPVNLLGPLGQGFRLVPTGHPLDRLLLVAESTYLPYLRPLYQTASSVALVVEATTRAQLPSPSSFPPALELILATRDGSAGYLGPLEVEGAAPPGLERAGARLRELLTWAERVCLACDPGRYPAFAQIVQETRLLPGSDFAQAFVRVPMPCGVGACDVCRITTRRGEQRACVEGPVFDLLDFLAT